MQEAGVSGTARLDWFFPFLAITLPVLLAVVGFYAAGWIVWHAGLLLVLASAAGALYLINRHRRHVAELRDYLQRAAQDPDQPLPEPPAPLGSLLSGELTGSLLAALNIGRGWRRDLRGLDAGKDAILAALPYPLLTLASERRVTRANRAANELFGDTLVGRDLISVLREPALLAGAEAVLDGEDSRTVEFTITGAITQHFVAQIQRLPMTLPDQTLAILALLDITALKRAEQLRADFVANASHELRTPLTSLMGFVETLQGSARDDAEAHARFLPIMEEQAKRMALLVDDLLSLSRIELHEHTPPDTAVELEPLLKRIAQSLSIKAQKRAITLVVQGDPLPPALGDQEELQQVFQNLIDNAIKYGRSDSQVTIETKLLQRATAAGEQRRRPGIAVSVIDQGEGIAREHLPRLTERFYRVDTARSRAMGGTGLGLAIVKHIVNRHRGKLEIVSEPGRGSIFTVQLRAAPSPGGRQRQTLNPAFSADVG
ncbi:MAG: ATP-binding protein [Pseudomonadota bacterium]